MRERHCESLGEEVFQAVMMMMMMTMMMMMMMMMMLMLSHLKTVGTSLLLSHLSLSVERLSVRDRGLNHYHFDHYYCDDDD